jgi:uncharacterized protein (TIGR01777 family)
LLIIETSEILAQRVKSRYPLFMKNRRLVIAGGSGFLGRGLGRYLNKRFDEIIVLTRGQPRIDGNTKFVHWDAQNIGAWAKELDGAVAVVNLVGRTVDCRKTAANKAVILKSRVDSVVAIANAMRTCKLPPPVWIQAATAHIFGDTEDEILDESSPIGTGFAPQVGLAWEAAISKHAPAEIRKVALRISFVLGRDGGPLKILARLARFGLGGTVGSGRQFMSWIHEEDLYRIIERAIDDPTMQGMYVATSPNPVRNSEFMRCLRKAVHRPWSPPAPAIMVRIGSFLLRTDPELALLGRRCIPTRLLKEGFVFQHPRLQETFMNLL